MSEPTIIETKNKIIILNSKKEANEYADQGYRLHTYSEIMVDGSYSQSFVMVLESGYSDVTRVADASVDEANGLLALGTGWEIASTSVSSKFYRMVKRATPAAEG